MERESRPLLIGGWPKLVVFEFPVGRPCAFGPMGCDGRGAPGRWFGSGPEFPPPGRGRSLLPRFGG